MEMVWGPFETGNEFDNSGRAAKISIGREPATELVGRMPQGYTRKRPADFPLEQMVVLIGADEPGPVQFLHERGP